MIFFVKLLFLLHITIVAKTKSLSTIDYKKSYQQNHPINEKKLVKKLVIVYIHGTFGLKEIFSIRRPLESLEFMLSLRNARKKKIWHKYKSLRWERGKDYFFSIMNTKKGFFHVKDHREPSLEFSPYATQALHFLKYYFSFVNHLLVQSEKNACSSSDFFVYNWSGSPYVCDRKEEAKCFYEGLEEIQNYYLKKGIKPIFCVIGYSHGGNLVLEVPLSYSQNTQTIISFLILLGTPIIDMTRKNIYIKNKMNQFFFDSIVNIYSPGDSIQISDLTTPNKAYFLGFKHTFGFSKRILKHQIKEYKKRSRVYNISCSYLFYKKKILPKEFYFSEIENHILYLNHYNLAYFKNFYKKTIVKRKFYCFYFPPAFFLIPAILSSILLKEIIEDQDINIFFQYRKDIMYIVERKFNFCIVKKKYFFDSLYKNYLLALQWCEKESAKSFLTQNQ